MFLSSIGVEQTEQIMEIGLVCKEWYNLSTDLYYIFAAHSCSGGELSLDTPPIRFNKLPKQLIDSPQGRVHGIMLRKLPSLTSLNMARDPEGEGYDVAQALPMLTNLKSLFLIPFARHPVSIDHLTGLTRLKTFDVFFKRPHPTTTTTLKSLAIHGMPGYDITDSMVSPFTSLTSLSLKTNTIKSWQWVRSLTNLTKLSLDCKIKLDQLGTMLGLLSLRSGEVIQPHHAIQFPSLTSLNVQKNLAKCNLSNFTHLKRLKVSVLNSMADYPPVSELVIYSGTKKLGSKAFTQVANMTSLTSLTSLTLKDAIVDLSPKDPIPTGLSRLNSITLKGTCIEVEFCNQLAKIAHLQVKHSFWDGYNGDGGTIVEDGAGGWRYRGLNKCNTDYSSDSLDFSSNSSSGSHSPVIQIDLTGDDSD